MASDPSSTGISRVVRGIGRGAPLLERTRALARLVFDGEMVNKHGNAIWDVSMHLAGIVGVSGGVRDALSQICETWNGRFGVRKVTGEALYIHIRVEHIARFSEIAHHRDGRAAAVALVKKRSGNLL